jgi:hypothetical protein
VCVVVNRCSVLGHRAFYRANMFDIKSLSNKTTYSPAHIHYCKRQLDTQVLSHKTVNVRITLTLWRARLTTVVVGAQECLPFLLLSFIWRCRQCNKYWELCYGNTAMRSLYCCSMYVAVRNTKHRQVLT